MSGRLFKIFKSDFNTMQRDKHSTHSMARFDQTTVLFQQPTYLPFEGLLMFAVQHHTALFVVFQIELQLLLEPVVGASGAQCVRLHYHCCQIVPSPKRHPSKMIEILYKYFQMNNYNALHTLHGQPFHFFF